MRPLKYKIILKEDEKETLEKLVKKHSTPQNIVKRAKIILMSNASELNNNEIATQLGIRGCDITRWTQRWIDSGNINNYEERLYDKPRSGKPPTITSEQWSKIMALACEKPENHGLSITHWSHSTLTKEVIKQSIVETISQSHIGDFLKKQSYNLTAASIG